MRVAGVVMVGIAAWAAAPWIAMARHGTLDQRAVAAWHAEPPRPHPAPSIAVPAPRTPALDSSAGPPALGSPTTARSA